MVRRWMLRAVVFAACGAAGCKGASQTSPVAPTCAAGEIVDGAACVPAACGVGRWGALSDVDAIFVDAAATGGDGSADAPLSSLSDALAGVEFGATIVLAAGSYPGPVTIEAPLILVGRCREKVEIVGGDGPTVAVNAERGDVVTLHELTITGGRGGVSVTRGALGLDRVVVQSAVEFGVHAIGSGAAVVATSLTVTGTTSTAPNAPDGYGIRSIQGAEFVGQGVEVLDSTFAGAVVDATATIALTDCTIADTRQRAAGDWGVGVTSAGILSLQACTVERNHGNGLLLTGGTALVEDSVIADVGANKDGTYGYGIDAESAAVIVRRTEIRAANTYGVFALGSDTSVSLEEVIVRDTVEGKELGQCAGIAVTGGATLTIHGGEVSGNSSTGIAVGGEGSTATVTGTAIVDTCESAAGEAGYGVGVGEGGYAEFVDVSIERNHAVGVLVTGVGAHATLRQSRVADTRAGTTAGYGAGIEVTEGAAAAIEDTQVARSQGVGVNVWGMGSTLTATRLSVAATKETLIDGLGWGVAAQNGGNVELTASTVTETHGLGVMVADPTTRATLADTIISDTRRTAARLVALGIYTADGGNAELTDVTIRGTEGPGTWVVDGGALLCTRCALTGNGFAGAVVVGGTLTLSDSDVSDNLADASLGAGIGILARYYDDALTTLRVDASTIEGNGAAGLWVHGPVDAAVTGSTVAGGDGIKAGNLTLGGHAILAVDLVTRAEPPSGLVVAASEIVGGAGPTVLMDAADAALTDVTWSATAVPLRKQRCSGDEDLSAYAHVIGAELCPADDILLLPLRPSLGLPAPTAIE